MPSGKPFLHFVIDRELLKRLDDFWHRYKFSSRSKAIIWLIEAGLKEKLAPKVKGD